MLKELLGENYREDMTVSEIEEQLKDVDLVDRSTLPKSVDKSVFDKTASELAELKKLVKTFEESKLTDEQLHEQKLKEAEEVKADYQRKMLTLDAKDRLISKGVTDTKLIESILGNISLTDKAAMENSVDVLVSAFQSIEVSTEQRIKEELLKSTPVPPPSDPEDPAKQFKDMTITERVKFKAEKPDLYEKIKGD